VIARPLLTGDSGAAPIPRCRRLRSLEFHTLILDGVAMYGRQLIGRFQ
jgi:hypothetical protein